MNSDKENIQFSPNEVRLTELSHSEVGHDYRLKKITEIQMSLEEERISRRRLSEKYYRIVTWVNNSDAVLIAVSMGLGKTARGGGALHLKKVGVKSETELKLLMNQGA